MKLETDLKQLAADVVRRATEGGATAAEAVAGDGENFSTVVRLGQVESLQEAGSRALGVRVFFGQRAASTYTSDFSPEGVEQLVADGLVTPFLTWKETHVLARQEAPMNEADRVAALLLAGWTA